MNVWIGPAIVAAVIAGIVNVLGWIITSRQSRASERRRREEKIRDFQVALRAEIRSELANLRAHDLEEHMLEIRRRYEVNPSYSVIAPHPARHVIFEAVSGEIQILPENVIDPIVLYTRQRQAIESPIGDIRTERFRQLDQVRQLEMYGDYISLRRHLAELAEEALGALDQSLSRR